MGERKGTNKYYPPDFDPGKGGLNKYHGTHALRERARKLHEGILIIRFEMPYNIWCNGCGNHVGMGVRYNAQKRKVGNYYTTPIYKFRMKCHLCDQHFEIQTDPKNCEYEILSGARRKEERWDPAVTENIQTTDRDVKAKLVSDAMFKLEHDVLDKQKAKKSAPTLSKLRDIKDVWHDDFAINQALRRKFRQEKKEIHNKMEADDDIKKRALLPSSMQLADETPEDADLAKRMRYGEGDVRPDLKRKKRKIEIKRSSIFDGDKSNKDKLARHIAGLARANQRIMNTLEGKDPHSIDSDNFQVVSKRQEIASETANMSSNTTIVTTKDYQSRDSSCQKIRDEKDINKDIHSNEDQVVEILEDFKVNNSSEPSKRNMSLIVEYSSSGESNDE